MAKQLVLVSHGRFCEELKASTEMIMGPQDNIHAVALLPEEGPEEFTAKFEACVADFEDYIVFADLLGLVGGEEAYPARAQESIVKVNDLLSNFDDDEDE